MKRIPSPALTNLPPAHQYHCSSYSTTYYWWNSHQSARDMKIIMQKTVRSMATTTGLLFLSIVHAHAFCHTPFTSFHSRSTKAERINIRNSSKTCLHMVFDVPNSALEAALDKRFEVEQSKSGTQIIIDSILDECTRYSARRPIMVQFDPEAKSIWRHWRGTVLAETWKSAAKHAIWAVLVYILFQRYSTMKTWLKGFQTIWGELLAVTTFTLTFFVNEAYSCWRKCLDICYKVQGRLNDLSMVRHNVYCFENVSWKKVYILCSIFLSRHWQVVQKELSQTLR